MHGKNTEKQKMKKDKIEGIDAPPAEHFVQARTRGAAGDSWYRPERDVVNLLPEMVRNIFVNYDDKKMYHQWANKFGLTEDEIEEAAKRMAGFVNASPNDPNFKIVIEESGLADLPLETVMLILSAVGWETLRYYHNGLFEIDPASQQDVVKMRLTSKAVTQFKFKIKRSLLGLFNVGRRFLLKMRGKSTDLKPEKEGKGGRQ